MKSFEAYDAILTRHCWTVVWFGLFAIIAIVAFYFWMRKTSDSKKEYIGPAVILGVLLLLVLGYAAYTICTTVHDVRNDAYIVYEGTYETGKDAKVYITDANGKRKTLSDAFYSLPDGTHRGRIVYSEKTEIIVDCQAYLN
ncbi:MAG: hypothetical protein IJV73_03350 [Clostridia bacterium]|nr:hypothetical protein [Clostridia bacterium]